MRVLLAALLALAGLFYPLSGSAQTGQKGAKGFPREVERHKANENLLVLMGGALGDSYLELAHDIAVVVNDGDKLRILPVASDGALANVRDLVLLKGVDLAITTVQTLNLLKASGEYGAIEQQVAYIAPLSVDTFHVLARPEIGSIKDLQGKKVSFNTKGSGTARFGPMVLKALGVSVTESTMAQGDALQAMRGGDLDATLCSCPLPIAPFAALQASSGFKLLEVPYIPELEQDYVPASLTDTHYPGLIAKDSKVQTIATSTVLITYNWPRNSERFRKVERFVNAFFSNLDKLKEPARHPAWKNVNLGATIRGWQRFPTAKEWLDRQASETAKVDDARAKTPKATPGPNDDQDRLFQEFMEWSRTKGQKKAKE
jgi:TRAP transporter TAXI family solute receptor